jgi:hypothetical protein
VGINSRNNTIAISAWPQHTVAVSKYKKYGIHSIYHAFTESTANQSIAEDHTLAEYPYFNPFWGPMAPEENLV